MPRAAVLHPDLQFSIETIPHPALLRGEVSVRIEYATLCSSDLHTASGRREEPLPTVLGHEACGFVEAIHPEKAVMDVNGEQLKVGDRVTWAVFANNCTHDSPGDFAEQKAPGTIKYGHLPFTPDAPLTGGLATHIILRDGSRIARVSTDIPAKALAPVNCSLATVTGAFRIAGNVKGKRVAVIGAGMLGIHATMLAHAMEAAQIAVVEPDPDRGAKAPDFGADRVAQKVIDLPQGEWDVLIETSGKAEAMEESIRLGAIGSTIVWVGAVYPQPAVRLNAEEVVRRLITLKGLHNYTTEDFRNAVEWISRLYDRYPLEALCGASYPLDEVANAFISAGSPEFHRVGILPA